MTAERAAAAAEHFPTTGPARDLFIALAELADSDGTFSVAELPAASATARLDAAAAGEAWELLLQAVGWITITGGWGHVEVGS